MQIRLYTGFCCAKHCDCIRLDFCLSVLSIHSSTIACDYLRRLSAIIFEPVFTVYNDICRAHSPLFKLIIYYKCKLKRRCPYGYDFIQKINLLFQFINVRKAISFSMKTFWNTLLCSKLHMDRDLSSKITGIYCFIIQKQSVDSLAWCWAVALLWASDSF